MCVVCVYECMSVGGVCECMCVVCVSVHACVSLCVCVRARARACLQKLQQILTCSVNEMILIILP